MKMHLGMARNCTSLENETPPAMPEALVGMPYLQTTATINRRLRPGRRRRVGHAYTSPGAFRYRGVPTPDRPNRRSSRRHNRANGGGDTG